MSEFKYTPATLVRIRELVRISVKEAAICVDLGCDLDTLRRIAKKHGLSLKPMPVEPDDGKPDRLPYERSPWPRDVRR